MTRREFSILLMGAWNEASKAIIRRLYAQDRGERDRAKLAPKAAPKAPKKRRKFGEMAQG